MYRDYHRKLSCVCIESATEQVQTASTFSVTPWSLDKRCRRLILTYYASHPEAHVLRKITPRNIIRVSTEIFARFGFPEELVSDYGKQFVSTEFETFLKSYGIKHARVSLLCKKQWQTITFS